MQETYTKYSHTIKTRHFQSADAVLKLYGNSIYDTREAIRTGDVTVGKPSKMAVDVLKVDNDGRFHIDVYKVFH